MPGEDLAPVHHYCREPYPHHRQRVVSVSGGNAAAGAALEMALGLPGRNGLPEFNYSHLSKVQMTSEFHRLASIRPWGL